MQKKYLVRLTIEERGELQEIVKKLKGTSQKVKRAQILLKADADGPNWTDLRIAEAFDCRRQTVESIRQRLVERGFSETLHGAKPQVPRNRETAYGRGQGDCDAFGSTSQRVCQWTLRLLLCKLVELDIVELISHELVRRTLKKMA